MLFLIYKTLREEVHSFLNTNYGILLVCYNRKTKGDAYLRGQQSIAENCIWHKNGGKAHALLIDTGRSRQGLL